MRCPPLTTATVRSGLLAVTAGAALLAAPAGASVVLPLSISGVTFSGFFDISGDHGVNISADCSDTFFGSGSAVCTGPVFYSGGPLGDGLHTTGSATGLGTISGGAAPRVQTTLSVSGGDTIDGTPITGAGSHGVQTQLTYYVQVVPLGTPPSPTSKIPLTFTDAGSVTGFASSTDFIGGEASTEISTFNGNLVVDGASSSAFDSADDSADGSSISASYGKSHSVVFDFSEGDPVAEVDLFASCSFASELAGFGFGDCTSTADPFIGFDQTAFDALKGPNTFPLSDFFAIVVSPGLEGGGGPSVPEPGSLVLLAAASLLLMGRAGLRAARRRSTG